VEDRLTELEVRVAFQERLIAELDEIVRALRDQVERLEADLSRLVEHLDDGGTDAP
jgi:uncharacterized coiled-coil protein SlyX